MTDSEASTEPTRDATKLSTTLIRLGLIQYEGRLKENGFDDWETVTTITENDLAELGFKLGDRRKLQRTISESTASPAKKETRNVPLSPQHPKRTTRQYRRHPRPDLNAPVKPKTAYVLFGEHVRRGPTLSRSSFAELAKETGKRWGELSKEERVNTWENPATESLQAYKEEFERYKQTKNYQDYKTYLDEFDHRRRNLESTTPQDDQTSSTSELESIGRLPSLGHEGSEATYEGGVDVSMGNQPSFDQFEVEDQFRDDISPVRLGMEEVRYILTSLGVNPHLIRASAFPPEDQTAMAVDDFIHGTGTLLYFWDQNEASNLVTSVYHPKTSLAPVHATEVFAMAAVGSFCDGKARPTEIQERFLHFFLSLLSSPSGTSDLRRMRLFACLAICRFMSSVESARRLMLSALDIGRQKLTSRSFKAEVSEEQAYYWWNVFRSIVFLESWFAYNTNHASRVIESDLTSYQPQRSQAGFGVFHQRVGELGQLAAYIALDLKTETQPRATQAQVRFESLEDWHRTLPQPIQLSRLSVADPLSMDRHTKRSLLQLHILFLGLFIEPYRYYLVDLAMFRIKNTTIDSQKLEGMKVIEEKCVLAARQSARVASLLQIDDLLRSQCWVSVYTSFTGCAILLLSASQKLLMLSGEESSQDLLYASSHLDILSLCSIGSDITRKLYTTLRVIFNDIREVVVSPVYRTMCELHIPVADVTLDSRYNTVEGAREISKTVLDLARRIIGVLQERFNF